MAVAELGAAGRDHAGDRRRAAGRDTGRHPPDRGRPARAAPPCASRRPAAPPPRRPPGRPRPAARRPPGSGRPRPRGRSRRPRRAPSRACCGGFRQHGGVDLLQDARQRHAPALVAPPGRGVERRPLDELRLGDLRRPRQAPGGSPDSASCWAATRAAIMRRNAFELVAGSQRLQPLGAAAEDRREIGQANRLALGDLAQYVFAEAAGRVARAAAQGLPTSWRNHLRWCFQAQPPVTEPRVMALHRALDPDGGIDVHDPDQDGADRTQRVDDRRRAASGRSWCSRRNRRPTARCRCRTAAG